MLWCWQIRDVVWHLTTMTQVKTPEVIVYQDTVIHFIKTHFFLLLKSTRCLSPTKSSYCGVSCIMFHFESYIDIRSLFLLLLFLQFGCIFVSLYNNSKMRQVVTILLMMLLGHVTSGQQYPDCDYICQNGECIVFLIIV